MVRSILTLFITITFSFLFISVVAAESALSIFPPIVLFVAAVVFTWRMGINGLIRNPALLIDALSFKVAFSALIYFIFWHRPLKSIGILTINSQSNNLGFQDSMFYQYHANIISEMDIKYWLDASRVTWQSEGVILYLAALFRLFGSELYNVVFINILLGYLAVVQLLQLGLTKNSRYLYLIVLWPHTLYYDIPPGKEALTNFLVYSIICISYRIFIYQNKISSFDLLKITFLLGLLVFVRVNVAVLLAVAIISGVSISKGRLGFVVFFFSAGGFLIWYKFGDVFGQYVEGSLDSSDNFEEKLEIEESSLKVFIAKTLRTDSAVINILLAPISFIIWILAPLPNIGLDGIYKSIVLGISYAQFQQGPHLGRLFASVWMLSNIFKKSNWINIINLSITNCNYRFVLSVTIILSFTIASISLVQGARYRVLVEPLLILLVMVASSDKASKAGSPQFPLS